MKTKRKQHKPVPAKPKPLTRRPMLAGHQFSKHWCEREDWRDHGHFWRTAT